MDRIKTVAQLNTLMLAAAGAEVEVDSNFIDNLFADLQTAQADLQSGQGQGQDQIEKAKRQERESAFSSVDQKQRYVETLNNNNNKSGGKFSSLAEVLNAVNELDREINKHRKQ